MATENNNKEVGVDGANAAAQFPIPPIGAPCWIEILAEEPEKSKDFYAALFPAWEFIKTPEAYKENNIAMFNFKEPKGLSGGIMKRPEEYKRGDHPLGVGFTMYFYVEDLEATEKRIHELGGTTVLEKKAESDHGFYMNFKDLDGNRFGAYTMNKEKFGC